MSQSSRTFCLLLDADVVTDLPKRSARHGPSYIEVRGPEKFVDRLGNLTRGQDGDVSIELEPIHYQSQQFLLMQADSASVVRATVNGLPASCLSVLTAGDVLGIGEHVLHVSLMNRSYIGPPSERHLAAKCGYCRTPIRDEADMRVYDCPQCHLPTHCQGEEVPVEKRLECVQLTGHCGHCQAEIVPSEGFSHVPIV